MEMTTRKNQNLAVLPTIPDKVLLRVFQFLTKKELVSASLVCRKWKVLSRANCLWRRRAMDDFHMTDEEEQTKLEAGDQWWYQEYVRLATRSPRLCVCMKPGLKPTACYGCFSHNGAMLAICLVNGFIRLFCAWPPFENLSGVRVVDAFTCDTKVFVQFNDDDTMLLVTVADEEFSSRNGPSLVALLQIVEGQHLLWCFRGSMFCDVLISYPCWLDANYLIAGFMSEVDRVSVELQVLSIYVKQVRKKNRMVIGKSKRIPLFGFIGFRGFRSSMALVSRYVSREARLTADLPEVGGGPVDRGQLQQAMETGLCTFCGARQLNSALWDTNSRCECRTQNKDRLLILAIGTNSDQVQQIAFKLIRYSQVQMAISIEELSHSSFWKSTYQQGPVEPRRAIVAGATETVGENQRVLHKVCQYSAFEVPDRVIDMNGVVLGMKLSSDERLLLVDVLPSSSSSAQSPAGGGRSPEQREINARSIDLETFTVHEELYCNFNQNKANARPSPLWYDATNSWLVSGAYDQKVNLWDRVHRCLVARLPHSAMAMLVAFHPMDEEMMVTISADGAIKTWRSRHRLEQLQA